MTTRYDYTLSADGYIVVQNGDARLLLDTGAPVSFGEKLLGIHGVTSEPLSDFAGFTAQQLSMAMGCHIDGVIGAEVLQTRTIHIDPVSQTLDFACAEIQPEQGVRIRHMMNVPIVDVDFDGRVIPTIFDTGAPLGYVPRTLIQSSEAVGIFDDFYPLRGAFRTNVFNIPIRIGEWEDTISFGVFPEGIEEAHRKRGCPTIIGLGLLKNYEIILGMREGLLRLNPLRVTNLEYEKQRFVQTYR